jgi:spore germination cell wall hydrolase CwlJ-like protein
MFFNYLKNVVVGSAALLTVLVVYTGMALVVKYSLETFGHTDVINEEALAVVKEDTPPPAPPPPPDIVHIELNEINCLAEAVYFEARSESIVGQIAVAQVIMNRVDLAMGTSTICAVVREAKLDKDGKPLKHKCQFSYYCDGKPEVIHNMKAYHQASVVAAMVIAGVGIEDLRDAVYYVGVGSSPSWLKDMVFVKRVGNHLFYNED